MFDGLKGKDYLMELNEVKRNELLSQSKKGSVYKNKFGSRWTSKDKCKVANTVADYNKIDMNTLWKEDKLRFGVKIKGETDNYIVTIQFNNLLGKIQNVVKNNKNKFDRDIVTKALMEAINTSDILVNCNCPDFKYRLAYWASQNGFKAGQKEDRPTEITNPANNKGSLCKHILTALNNASWIRNISSVIVNYANYCRDNMEYNYSKFIFPKIFGIQYNKAVQMCFDDYDENGNLKDNLKSDEEIINLSNSIAKNRFKKKK